jgi:hypothetical protein
LELAYQTFVVVVSVIATTDQLTAPELLLAAPFLTRILIQHFPEDRIANVPYSVMSNAAYQEGLRYFARKGYYFYFLSDANK